MKMQDLDQVRDKWIAATVAAATPDALEQIRVEALGKKGEVSLLMKSLGGLDPEARREAGQRLNAVKDAVTAAIETRKQTLSEASRRSKRACAMPIATGAPASATSVACGSSASTPACVSMGSPIPSSSTASSALESPSTERSWPISATRSRLRSMPW